MSADVSEGVSLAAATGSPDVSIVVISLLKGVIYKDGDERLWGMLLNLQSRVRDFVSVLALDLVVDEAEGYAFLKSRPDPAEGEDASSGPPRLIARRQLSFPVSLLLALLRRKLAEFDAGGGETRLVLTRDDIVDALRVFLPVTTNEAKLIDQIDAHIAKAADLGFLRRLKGDAGPASFEVRRILKAFVDAQWLAEFDRRLETYRSHLQSGTAAVGAADE